MNAKLEDKANTLSREHQNTVKALILKGILAGLVMRMAFGLALNIRIWLEYGI